MSSINHERAAEIVKQEILEALRRSSHVRAWVEVVPKSRNELYLRYVIKPVRQLVVGHAGEDARTDVSGS